MNGTEIQLDLQTKNDREKEAISAKFRSLFGSAPGMEVLAHLLDMLRFFEPIEDDGDIARHNLAIELLRWTKVITRNKPGAVSNVEQLTKQLMIERA